jgi:Kef-type K+ transport system membrane component KefB
VTSFSLTTMVELVAICAVACIGKFAGSIVPARMIGLNWTDSLTIGLLMNTRGLTELIVLNVGMSLGVLDDQMFAMLVIMALFTTSLASPIVSRLGPDVIPVDVTPEAVRL